MKIIDKITGSLIIGLISIYKYGISPLTPASCRYTPTCSEYGIQAVRKHGVLKGLLLFVKRLGRCHPWGDHGYDPVPDKSKK